MKIKYSSLPKEIGFRHIVPFIFLAKEKASPVVESELSSTEFWFHVFQLVKMCHSKKGLGLAAPQIGWDKSVFVVNTDGGIDEYEVLFNPTYKPTEGSVKVVGIEECLSVPMTSILVERYNSVDVTWHEPDKIEPIFLERKETLTGISATVFQHENDHLLGKTIVDSGKMNRQEKRELLNATIKKGRNKNGK